MRILSTLGAALALAACATPPALQLAVLAPTADPRQRDANTMSITSALKAATARSEVGVGPNDLYKGSVIPVLPPRPTTLEGRSLARPTLFDLMIAPDGACYLVHQESGEKTPVRVDCVPADKGA